MPYYRSNWERRGQRRETEVRSEEMIRVSDEYLSFTRKYGIGPRNLRGRHLIEIDVLDHDMVRLVARKNTLVLLTQGEGDQPAIPRLLEAKTPIRLSRASILIPEHPEQRLSWSSSERLSFIGD